MDGLQRWAEQELSRRNVKTVAEAIVVPESLYELRSDPKRDRAGKKGGDKEKGGGAPINHGSSSIGGKFSKDNWKSKKKSSSGDKGRHKDCFLCGEPHWVRECPQKLKLSAIVAEYDDKARSDDEERMGSLRLLNKIAKEGPKNDGKKLCVLPRSSGLVYVDAIVNVNGKRTKSLFDCGASHNFVTREEAARLGVKYAKEIGSMKAVNSSSIPIHGIAKGVPLRLGEWEGTADFTVVTMDDFAMVLGMEFVDSVRPVVFEETGH